MSETKIENITMSKIQSSKLNPRKLFDETGLQELADSIKEEGLLQPITVRPAQEREGFFEVVIGERRFRACKMLKMETIKAIITDMDDGEARTVMLIENLQREDLTELEEGIMFQELYEKLKVPIREIARKIGKSFGYVDRRYRIVKQISPLVQEIYMERMENGKSKLDFTIAEQIAPLPHKEQEVLAKKAVEYGYTKDKVIESINQAEELEATLDKLPPDEFREQLEREYLPKKFDSTTLPEVQVKILREKGLWIEQPQFNADVVPLIQKLQMFVERYKERSVILEWSGDAEGNMKILEEIKKLLLEDKLKHLAFVVKI